jgi:hypothetical protein
MLVPLTAKETAQRVRRVEIALHYLPAPWLMQAPLKCATGGVT